MSLQDKASIIWPKGAPYKAGSLAAWNPQGQSLVEFNVVRATTATRVNEAGLIESVAANVIRRDFTNGGCGDYLIEKQSTNLALYSEDFDNVAFWAKQDSPIILSDTEIAPDGTTTADRFVAGDNLSQIQGVAIGTSGVDYTGSIYIKRISGSGVVNLRVAENADIPVSVTSEWTRVSATVTSTSTIIRIGVRLETSGDEVAIWGAQLEEGSYPTSYIPTVASAVTRNADVVSLSAASALLGDSAGGMFIEAAPFDISASFRVSISDGTTNNRVNLSFGSSITVFGVVDGVTTAAASGGGAVANTFSKIAMRYAVNDYALYQNGSSVATDTDAITFPDGTLSRVGLDIGQSGVNEFFGRIRQFVIFNQAPTNTQLGLISTP